ncbi:hypothetical protein KP509_13G033000 [Ceratopteris richardii]|uniref:Uncharacterized protein n=1 Tax=Ceratopteris richardii TaxID=49495 RepID=A0A8T2TGK9_CERRI|nr:hypothetical protein KP509_13G033000 [Ceratopteris richardii]
MGGDVNSLSNSIEEGAIHLFKRLRGKIQRKPLVELLESYGLPKGLFPKNETHYEVKEDTRKLSVFVPYLWEVGFKDSSVLKYATKVTWMLSQGQFSNIEGLKIEILV